jgi:hypothetical protein
MKFMMESFVDSLKSSFGCFHCLAFSLSLVLLPFMLKVENFVCMCRETTKEARLQKEAFVQVDDSEEINFSLVPLTKCPLSAYIL